jgi:hypothetical protein
MEKIKNGLINNKFLLVNLNSFEILANLLIIALSFIFLTGNALYLTAFVAISHLFISMYILNWSVKQRIYHSDKLLRFKLSKTLCAGFILFTFYCIKTIFQAGFVFFMVSFLVNGTLSKEPQAGQLPEWFRFFFLFCFIIAILGYGFIIYSKVELLTSHSYKGEIAGVIDMFRLNINETTFFASDFNLTGFVSAGFIQTTEGIYYKDNLFKNLGHIVNYLHTADLNLNELNDEHIQIIKMYNI